MQSKLAKFVAALALAGVVGAHAAAPAAPQGAITAKEFLGITGTAVANLTNHAKFPNNPDVVAYPSLFEWPTSNDPAVNPPGNVKADYGVQIIGYFYPETSGNHQFYISADDGAVLYLSTDDNPANKRSIAVEPQWNGVRDYLGTARRPVDAVTGLAANQSAPINLTANRAYYIEALMKEGGGGDNLSVAAVMEGEVPVQPILGARLATFDKTSGAVSVETAPASQTIGEGQPFSLKVVAQGTPPYEYQWIRNGQDIADATNDTLNVAAATMADNNASYTVRISNAQGSVTSPAGVITITPDTTAPTVVSARGNRDLNQVTVIFSEPVTEASATVAANYSISPSVAVTGATMVNPTTVRLNTGAQTQGSDYTLTVTGVKDIAAAGNTISTGNTAAFKAWLRAKGFLAAEFFRGISGTALQGLLDAEKYQNNQPDVIRFLGAFETPNAFGDNYGARVTGWLVPQVSGDYHFFVRADDQAALFINPDGEALPDASDPFAAVAYETSGCCQAFQETDLGLPETTQVPITLQAGRKYGVVFIMKEGGGGDWSQVAWRRVGDTTPAGQLRPMSGDLFESWVDPTGASITFTNQPSNITVVQNRSGTFSATVGYTGNSVSYQWLKNGEPIPGATSPTYSTPLVTLADNNAKFSLRVRVPGFEQLSQEATLTVTADTTAPTIVSAGAFPGASTVGVKFDEALDEASAESAANYSVSGGVNVTAATLHPSGVVELTLSGAVGSTFTVTVNGVKDAAGNAVSSATVTGQISDLQHQDVGTEGDPILPGQAFYAGNGTYYVAGGGSDIWGNADHFHYAYKEVTGPFDARVQVDALVDLVPQDAWAKAGIMIRESLEAGSRNQMAVMTRNQGNGQNQYTFQWRDTLDAASASLADGSRVRPVIYPSWLRVVRETATSSELKVYFSQDNGTTWRLLGSHTFPDPLPEKLLVGLGTTSHGNAELQASGDPEVLAQGYYSNFSVVPFTAVVDPMLTIGTAANGQVTISWQSGTLHSADNAAGPYSPVANATSPMSITPSGNAKFYRVRQ